MGLMPYLLVVIELPPDHGAGNMERGDTDRESVVEDMLTATGFIMVERGAVDVVNEWADVEVFVRALAAEVISPLCDREVGVRVASEFGWIVAGAD
jgi:hypothetical protein